MTDELAKVLHDAARDSLADVLLKGEPKLAYDVSFEDSTQTVATFILNHLRFGERMAPAVEMASTLHDFTTGQTISIPVLEGLLARWQEMKP